MVLLFKVNAIPPKRERRQSTGHHEEPKTYGFRSNKGEPTKIVFI